MKASKADRIANCLLFLLKTGERKNTLTLSREWWDVAKSAREAREVFAATFPAVMPQAQIQRRKKK